MNDARVSLPGPRDLVLRADRLTQSVNGTKAMDVVRPGRRPHAIRVRRHLVHVARAPRDAEEPVDGEHTLYGFLTTAPDDVVRPAHSKAMPAILTEPAEFDAWLEADVGTALAAIGEPRCGRREGESLN